MDWIRRHLTIILPVGAVALAGVAYLAFGIFGVHTLFIDDRVDDAGPVFDSGASADAAAPAPVPTDESVADVADSVPASTVPETAPADDGGAAAAESAPVTAPPTTVPAEPQIVTLVEGDFIPRGRYSGEGDALVLTDGSEQRFLRFENFATDNGPDLRVYLVNSDANAEEGTFDDDFVDLGELRGNIGDQNYEIPPDVDLAVYDTVVVWCVRFSSAFTAADLLPVA